MRDGRWGRGREVGELRGGRDIYWVDGRRGRGGRWGDGK